MYYRKIAQWGLDKKHKGPEMRAILRIARQREAAGQESVFRVRGRRCHIEEVYRYFQRKGEDPARIVIAEWEPIPLTVTVETPSLVPVKMGMATTTPEPLSASALSRLADLQMPARTVKSGSASAMDPNSPWIPPTHSFNTF